MELIGGFWHFFNLFAPAAGLGMIAAGLSKLFWRRELRSTSWLRLALCAAGASAVVVIGGLVAFGHDGKMATYAAMVLASALALWWAGFGGQR